MTRSTISISWIDDSNAISRGYGDLPLYAEGAWVVELNGEWLADLERATLRARGSSWQESLPTAQSEAETVLDGYGITMWSWSADSVYDPPRDFIGTSA